MIINSNIFYTYFKTVPQPKANIIVTHGLTESSHDYIELSEYLNKAGYNVLLYDVRGHGKTSGKRGDISHYSVFLKDLSQLVLFMKQQNDLKIFLFGHSMGGIITNCYAVTYFNIDGVIVSSAPTCDLYSDRKYFEKYLKYFSYLKYLYYPYYLFNFKKIKVFSISDRKRCLDSDHGRSCPIYRPYNLECVTPRLMRNILIMSAKYLHRNLDKYLVPCLIIHSKKDRLVSPSHSEFLFSKVQSTDKELKLYNDSGHNLFNEKANVVERQTIIDNMIAWLEKRI